MQEARVDNFSRMPLYQQVRDSLVTRIQSGEWHAGQPIPNEGDLARAYNVSSGTMRKALDLMELQRFLVRKQGRGTFISTKLDDDTPPETAVGGLAAIGATLAANGAKVRLPNGKVVDAEGLRGLMDSILDAAAWVERRSVNRGHGNKAAA
jgi:DNA-binding GntR family transcriptional regulator